MQPSREAFQEPPSKAVAKQRLGAMPTVFVENDGQWPPEIKFGAKGRQNTAALTERGITFSTRVSRDEASGTEKWQAVALNFFAPDRPGKPIGEQKLKGVHNYLIGNDPSKWCTGVALYEAVCYDDVAPGISMIVTERDGKLEYDLHVEAGADLSKVDVTCDGAESIEIDENGELLLATKDAVLSQAPPIAWYEMAHGERKVADCRFRLTSSASFGFDVLNPDPSSKLIVDPGLMWSTYLGDSGSDIVTGVDFNAGLVTVVGITDSSAFPTLGGYSTSLSGGTDAFATSFDPTQSTTSQLVWSTFIGGSNDDKARGVAVASNGDVALCGDTASSNFPTTAYASQPSQPGAGSVHGFVCYLLPSVSGSGQLRYSTYYGGASGYTFATALAMDSTPKITIVGFTSSSNLLLSTLPLLPYDTNRDGIFEDACVAQFNPLEGTTPAKSLLYSSYVGGNGTATEDDRALCVAVESQFVFIGGYTKSTGFHTANVYQPVAGPYQPTHSGGLYDGFLMKVMPSDPIPANQLKYSTFLGTYWNGPSSAQILGLDAKGGAFYACGVTSSPNFPVSTGTLDEASAFDSTHAGLDEGIIVKIDPTNTFTQLRYSTFIGGDSIDWAYSLKRVSSQCVVVVGKTQSSDFPLSGPPMGWPPFSSVRSGLQDAFLARVRWAPSSGGPRVGLAQLDYSTYIGGATIPGGGSDVDAAFSLVIDGLDAYFGGMTTANDYPTAGNPYDAVFSGIDDGFVSNLGLPPFWN